MVAVTTFLPLGKRQREKLAGAAGRQDGRGAFARQKVNVAAQAVEVEGIVIIKRGYGKRDHGAQAFAQFRWGHHWNVLLLNCVRAFMTLLAK